MKKTIGLVHALARCDCGWEYPISPHQTYKNAQAMAAQHAKRYGHRVTGEIGLGFTYDATETPNSRQSK